MSLTLFINPSILFNNMLNKLIPLSRLLTRVDAIGIRNQNKTVYSILTQLAHLSSQTNNSNNDAVHKRIEKLISDSTMRTFVFMKGTPDNPMCKFSGAVAAVLQAYKEPFDSVNVLEDEDIRNGIKKYSDWPTIPQVYVNKEFVGGCDIIIQMHKNGELEKLLAAKK